MSQQIKRASEVLQAIKRADAQPSVPGNTLKNVGAVGAGGVVGAGINHLFGQLLYPDDPQTQTYAAALGTVGGMGVGALARAQGVMKALPAGAGALVVEGLVGPHTAQARAATQASKAETAAAHEQASAAKAQAAAVGKLNAGEQLKTLWNDNPSVRGATAGIGFAGLGGLATGLSRAKTDEELRQNASRAAMVRDDIIKWLAPSVIGGAVIGGVTGGKKAANGPEITGLLPSGAPSSGGSGFLDRPRPIVGGVGAMAAGSLAGWLFNREVLAPAAGYSKDTQAMTLAQILGAISGGAVARPLGQSVQRGGFRQLGNDLATGDVQGLKLPLYAGVGAEIAPVAVAALNQGRDTFDGIGNQLSTTGNEVSTALKSIGEQAGAGVKDMAGAVKGIGDRIPDINNLKLPETRVNVSLGGDGGGSHVLGGALLGGGVAAAMGALRGLSRDQTPDEVKSRKSRAEMVTNGMLTHLLPGLLLGAGAGYGVDWAASKSPATARS